MKNISLLIFNSLTFCLTLFLNYLYGSGVGERKSVGEISNQFDTLITPAGYAFAIWGLIYLLLFGFLLFQWISFFKKQNHKSLVPASVWFGLSNIFNGMWIVVWTSEMIGTSVLVIFALLGCLMVLVFRLRLEIWDAPLDIIAFVWWPICIYTGWVVVATVVNTSVLFYTLDLLENHVMWTVMVLIVATIIYLILINSRNMREAALVGVWAYLAIFFRQLENETLIAYSALILAGILFLSSIYHAYKNRRTNPLAKLLGK
jgi:hypothetical protein